MDKSPIPTPDLTKGAVSTLSEVRMGQDELLKSIRERPEKVLDAILEMCDHAEELAARFWEVPLGTPQGVVEGSKLQGRALALQVFVGTLFDKLTEKDIDDNATD